MESKTETGWSSWSYQNAPQFIVLRDMLNFWTATLTSNQTFCSLPGRISMQDFEGHGRKPHQLQSGLMQLQSNCTLHDNAWTKMRSCICISYARQRHI